MEYTGWLIYSEQDANENKSYINWFIQEASKQGLNLKLILREHLQIGIVNQNQKILLNNSPVKQPTFAIVRTVEPLLNAHLEELGVEVFNSSSVSRLSNHKGITHMEVHKLNIPMVDTYFYKKEGIPFSSPIPFPFVVKEVTGRGGKQVFFIKDQLEWQNCQEKLTNEFLIQSSSNVQLGKDIRVFVVGKEIIGSVLRESNSDFRANYKLGGSAKWYELSLEEVAMISKIINHFDFGMVGIDFLVGEDGTLIFNEIEDVVGSRTLSAVSNKNILESYVTFIKNKLSGNFNT
ncbi:gamma-F420-2:alpha-L-glutamate ligase [Oceanobacillus limi]|uniref:Gamma-F420-2:alpha-L-glutamate ligase n=1 Tax=Oceanobacillus limi TaxID=930131 RepID=A0A1I0GIJ6_9BACI|nr:ATP-grasp domain-containing protein [Oceanobacillus limi]SET69947.1 gamma-F420-2:alpha-L-glutamate ligase [Oceanobacillus limi]